jgi:hypothetical protein
VEEVFGVPAARVAAQLHGVGDVQRYNARMAAIEYSIEHDDGQSLRAMDKAEIVLIAPSRCGKTPTTMYLRLQHGLFVANYPLVEEDLESTDLPAADPAPQGPHRRAGRDARAALRGAAAAPPELRVRLARAVHLRAASRRGHVCGQPASGHQLDHQVGRGDVHPHRPDPCSRPTATAGRGSSTMHKGASS